MAERTRLVELRCLDSRAKAAQVLVTLDAMVVAGSAFSIAALARRAGVSRRFIYDHPELRAEAERRSAEIADRHGGALVASARVSAASLRADLANATAQNQRLEAELAALRRRLGQVLGQEVLADLATNRTADAVAALAPRVGELERELFEAQEQLARGTEEIEAARQINRELLARLNRQGR
ncbi:MAG: DUF6262 family protein [Acidimicrobiales bacterium]